MLIANRAMADRIRLEGLILAGSIGAYEHERGIPQELQVDITVQTDLREAAASDALALTIDYDVVAQICRDVVGEGHHALIETVAEKMAGRILARWPRVAEVEVRVAKPGAVADARNVAVEIKRLRRD